MTVGKYICKHLTNSEIMTTVRENHLFNHSKNEEWIFSKQIWQIHKSWNDWFTLGRKDRKQWDIVLFLESFCTYQKYITWVKLKDNLHGSASWKLLLQTFLQNLGNNTDSMVQKYEQSYTERDTQWDKNKKPIIRHEDVPQ